MGLSEMVADMKTHLEHGAELLASHVPGLIEWAEKAESDPLVQAALNAVLPASARATLAELVTKFEADFKQIEADATANAAAAAANAAAAPAEGEPVPTA